MEIERESCISRSGEERDGYTNSLLSAPRPLFLHTRLLRLYPKHLLDILMILGFCGSKMATMAAHGKELVRLFPKI
jgi:hypothetical protein